MGELTPYLCVEDARKAMQWYADELGAEPPDPPEKGRGAAVSLHLDVPDVDAVCARVTGAGVVLDRGPEDNPDGRRAVFRDPFGHRWMLADHRMSGGRRAVICR